MSGYIDGERVGDSTGEYIDKLREENSRLSVEVTKWHEMAEFWKRRADQRQIDINELKQNPALVLEEQTQ